MIETIYEDGAVVVCIKPDETVSEAAEGASNSLPNLLINEKGYKELFTVHRLDKDVSGLIVYAKTKAAAAELSKQITEGIFAKEYIAAVEGKVNENETLTDLLYFDKSKNKSYVVKKERRGVKRAELKYTLISYDAESDTSYVKIALITGRTHQIRIQFASRKHPVIGDKKYGSKHSVKPIKLYSAQLEFISPITAKPLSFSSTPDWF